MDRTIAAIATPYGVGGISVIRVSGNRAIEIVDKIFTKNVLTADTHTVHYGFIKTGDEYIDEVLVTVMKGPKTFTGEDVVEIGTHGGILVTNKVLDACVIAGAELAEAGEFTKRAFINGKIDLARAEAVIDLINSDSQIAEQNAVNQLRGGLTKAIEDIRGNLVDLAAHMQVSIDYPDEDLEEITTEDIFNTIKNSCDKVNNLIKSADDGRIIKDGIRTVIIGKPNVGKSALMNTLAGYEKAIVTDIAGTTRDMIEENISLGGIPIKLIDTAGIHDTVEAVEKIGVERSVKSIDGADLVLVILDGSHDINDEDKLVIEKSNNTKRIIIANKSDIGAVDSVKEIADVCISAKTGDGIEELTRLIMEMYKLGEISSKCGEIITNIRHKKALINCFEALQRALNAIENDIPQDLAAMDVNLAIDSLGEITGETVSEDIVSAVFKNFCVGK